MQDGRPEFNKWESLIPQQSSWGRLVIDESSIRKILTSFNVFPPFIDVVRAFGEKTGFEDDSYGGLRFRTDYQNNVHGGYLTDAAELFIFHVSKCLKRQHTLSSMLRNMDDPSSVIHGRSDKWEFITRLGILLEMSSSSLIPHCLSATV